MKLLDIIDPETGVRSFEFQTRGEKSERQLADESRERNRLHIAAMADASVRAATATISPEDEHAALLRAGNPPPPEPVPSELPNRRMALAALLQAFAEARAVQLALNDQVAGAVRYQSEAKSCLASASGAVRDAKAAAAQKTASWLAGGQAGERPDTCAVAAATASAAIATSDAGAADGALNFLRGELATATSKAEQFSKSAQQARNAVPTALAVDLAYQYAFLEAEMAKIRWQLIGYNLSNPPNTYAPAIVEKTCAHKSFRVDLFRENSPIREAYRKEWEDWRKALMVDPNAEPPSK